MPYSTLYEVKKVEVVGRDADGCGMVKSELSFTCEMLILLILISAAN